MISEEIVRVLFMPGHTIEGVVKKENKHDVSTEELSALMERYAQINGLAVPVVGQSAQIPILQRHVKND